MNIVSYTHSYGGEIIPLLASGQSMFCPEGSTKPSGVGECPAGHYCPAGIRMTCPIGTYCPRDGHSDPMPCPPGEFNAMVGQKVCTVCPRGYICPGFGRIDPAPCPAGMVCSRTGLTSPNQRCPPGETQEHCRTEPEMFLDQNFDQIHAINETLGRRSAYDVR